MKFNWIIIMEVKKRMENDGTEIEYEKNFFWIAWMYVCLVMLCYVTISQRDEMLSKLFPRLMYNSSQTFFCHQEQNEFPEFHCHQPRPEKTSNASKKTAWTSSDN